MGTLLTSVRKIVLLAICATVIGNAASASVLTAVLSGNFNSSLTWGGIIPGLLLTSDTVIIPSGITVTLTSDETISGASELTVNGTLNYSGAYALTITSGTLSGTGTINVDSLVLSLTSGFACTGTLMASTLVSAGINMSSAATTTVRNSLYLSSGTLNLTAGSFTLGAGSMIDVAGGNITVGGTGALHLDSTYSVDYIMASATTGAELGGTGLNNVTVNVPGSVTLSGNLNLNGTLTLTSGTLSLNGNTLQFNSSGNLTTAGGTLTGSATSNITVNTSGSLSGSLMFASGGNMLGNLTINSGSSGGVVTLGSSLNVNGTLALTSGSLSLNGYTLALNSSGSLTSAAAGSLTGSASSNLTINSSGSLTGALNFSSGGNLLDNLTINMGSASDTVMLGSGLTINGTLNLQSGRITLGNNNLTIASGGALTGGTANSYIVTNGGGSLVGTLSTGQTDTFKIGTYANYAPMAITANSVSTSGQVSVNMMSGVLSNGTSGVLLSATQPLVNATWYVSSTASAIDYTLMAEWSAGMEVNSFNRADAYISHYTGGVWDTTAASAAVSMGSMYYLTRSGITSLSPFMVAQAGAVTSTGVPAVAQTGECNVYPNPASNTLCFSTPKNVGNIAIFDVYGREVKSIDGSATSVSLDDMPAGTYIVRFSGDGVSEVRKFVKE